MRLDLGDDDKEELTNHLQCGLDNWRTNVRQRIGAEMKDILDVCEVQTET